jgi:hypothetical protein
VTLGAETGFVLARDPDTVTVVVLDPDERTATVYRGGGDAHVYGAQETLDLERAVPGLRVAVGELFARARRRPPRWSDGIDVG